MIPAVFPVEYTIEITRPFMNHEVTHFTRGNLTVQIMRYLGRVDTVRVEYRGVEVGRVSGEKAREMVRSVGLD